MNILTDPHLTLSIATFTVFIPIAISIMLKEDSLKPILYKLTAGLILTALYGTCIYWKFKQPETINEPLEEILKTTFICGAAIATVACVINDYKTGFFIGILEFGIIAIIIRSL